MNAFSIITLRGAAGGGNRRLFRLLCFLVALPVLLQAPPRASAASFAEDHTVLYYLIEMQRRAKRTCDGRAMPEAPSLMPSESLRRLAGLSASSGRPVAALAAEHGLSGIPYLAATTYGTTPQQAFDALVSSQCAPLMGPEYHFIGASADNGKWTLILAAVEPGRTATAESGGAFPLPGAFAERDSGAAPGYAAPEAHDGAGASAGAPLPADRPQAAPPASIRDMAASSRPSAAPPPRPARAGVVPLEDTRPRSAMSGDGTVILHQQPGLTGGAPEGLLPAAPAPGGMISTAPGGVSAPVAPGNMPAPAPGGVEPGGQASFMIGLVNAARARGHVCGGTFMPPVPALRGNTLLNAGAFAHARDMVARRYFSSASPDGRTLGRRIADGGYVWSFVAENLSAGRASAGDALNGWLANEKQCRNLMGREYEDIGAGFEPAGAHWVVILAAPMEERSPLPRSR